MEIYEKINRETGFGKTLLSNKRSWQKVNISHSFECKDI